MLQNKTSDVAFVAAPFLSQKLLIHIEEGFGRKEEGAWSCAAIRGGLARGGITGVNRWEAATLCPTFWA